MNRINLGITFCNSSIPYGSLSLFNASIGSSFSPGAIIDEVSCSGGTGICYFKEKLTMVEQNKYRNVLDYRYSHWDIVRTIVSKGGDWHGICCHRNKLFIASSADDSIYFASDPYLYDLEKYWTYPGGGDGRFHVNDVISDGDNLLVSLLGEKTGDSWLESEGYIIELSASGDVIIVDEGIRGPHSLGIMDDYIIYCASLDGEVRMAGSVEVLAHIPGYARGLAWDEEYFYIGSSQLRRVSRHSGKERDVQSTSPYNFGCGIFVVHRKSGVIADFISLEKYASEIYDIIVLENNERNI